jgi:hypothetical protein
VIKMGSSRNLLLVTVITLILVGLSYSVAFQQGFVEASLTNATLIELIPEECRVISASENVIADIQFNRDRFGNIADKTFIELITKNVHAGSSTAYCITAQNIGDIPLTIDRYILHVDNVKSSIYDLMHFSGAVKLYRNDGTYYDVLGTFNNISFPLLEEKLTAIVKYRKIDSKEKLVLELKQQFDMDSDKYREKVGLSYRLVPVFFQYFPSENAILTGDINRSENVF